MDAFGPLTFSHSSKNAFHRIFKDEKIASCLFCTKTFVLPQDKTLFSTHLFRCHQFKIADTEKIASVSMYCEYWRSRFQTEPPEKICSRMISDTRDDGSRVSFLLLGDFVPEDKKLREDLQNKQLRWALRQQTIEREDKSFSRGCLMCRLQFIGCRADYLCHLSLLHNLQLGRPENLVFVDELLDLIELKIRSLQCLFCSKIFKNQIVLKEHMRKKQHKKINPKDTEFDKFYMINYLEVGKDWRQIQNEPDDELSNVENSDGYVSDGDWSDWQEDEDPVVCLFCDISSTFDNILSHMNDAHGFDFTRICVETVMDFYQQVKVVNYVRRQVYTGHCPCCNETLPNREKLLEHMNVKNHFVMPQKQLWDHPEYFFPTYENDSFLCHLNDCHDDIAELHLTQQMKEKCQVGSC
ncbi:zinc finger protein 277 isoform X2 [Zootermopsis nevadensis]|nr:zinc finger protein 277 isoform X2 [Zootermopsis nevadensis]XP_021927402.1 zinc finger protein 277 isoform X2 [Zootermopsis nevadensis]XP_021927403.1 zinc finger protein 277 isoform X2 [Zootermopsis nevadensis]XP_021927404.1 zinc finger protein 277 isoform X2 [Zootermopsis nevadensis]